MTWKPIGPEQMDGRKYIVGWNDMPDIIEVGVYVEHKNGSGWLDILNLEQFALPPTHYLPGVRPLGEEETQSGKTVRVRVAVAVDNTGDWAASGANGMDDADAIESAQDCLNFTAQLSWITADLPVPQVKEIVGSVDSQ